tara:strand:- start:5457 stop:5660 length:204 start_codon:yes stop_codon:yes gene_type:complete
MNILPSSPYAAFSAKDWKLMTNSSRLVDPFRPARIKKKYYRDFVKFEIQEDFNIDDKSSETIQLSFA